jgi:hypothetical protein
MARERGTDGGQQEIHEELWYDIKRWKAGRGNLDNNRAVEDWALGPWLRNAEDPRGPLSVPESWLLRGGIMTSIHDKRRKASHCNITGGKRDN